MYTAASASSVGLRERKYAARSRTFSSLEEVDPIASAVRANSSISPYRSGAMDGARCPVCSAPVVSLGGAGALELEPDVALDKWVDLLLVEVSRMAASDPEVRRRYSRAGWAFR